MKLLVNNSFSIVTGITRSQLLTLQDELAVKSVTYGYCYLKKLPAFIEVMLGNNAGLWVVDAKGESRALTTKNLRRYKTVEDATKALRNKSPVIYRGWIKNHRPLIDAKGTFPTGLVRRFLAMCKAKNWSFDVEDRRMKPELSVDTKLRAKYPHIPYDEQREAAMACSAAARGVVVASTGVGKSLIIAQIIQNLQLKTLVVVPSLELKAQLTISLKAIFGEALVGTLIENRHITVENVQAVGTSNKGYDCLIIDEFHHAASATYQALNACAWDGIYYRFGVTATPFRNEGSEDILLEGILADVIYDLPYAKAVAKGYIVPLEAFYVDVPMTSNVRGTTWAEVYNELVVQNVERNTKIWKMLVNLGAMQRATLCIVKEILHGELLTKTASPWIPFANGQDGGASETIRNFNEQTNPVLVGTQGVLGEGIDTRPAEWIILAGLGKSRPATMQAIGRCFRKYPGKESGKVILIRDRSHRWTLKHFQEQCKILKQEYGVTPVKIEL